MTNTKPGSMMRTCLVKRVTSESRKANRTPTSVPPRLTTKKDTARGKDATLGFLNGPLWLQHGLTHVAWARLVRLAFPPGHSSWQLPGNPPNRGASSSANKRPILWKRGLDSSSPTVESWGGG